MLISLIRQYKILIIELNTPPNNADQVESFLFKDVILFKLL